MDVVKDELTEDFDVESDESNINIIFALDSKEMKTAILQIKQVIIQEIKK